MDIKAQFHSRLPHHPYCTNDPETGLLIRVANTALGYRHIQPNQPKKLAWLIFDIDRAGGAFAWEWALLPPPTISVINPKNGHAHLFYGLISPIGLSTFSRDAPIRYAAAIQNAFCLRLGADPSYVGLIAKNPLHGDWHSIFNPVFYDLSELAEYVCLARKNLTHSTFGLGRNCSLFDEVRAWAYLWIMEYKRNQISQEHWLSVVQVQAEKANCFQSPLSQNEVRSIAKSIAKWTWRNFSESSFSKIQSERGKLGGRPKTTTKNSLPWEVMGVSRATYYRRQKL